MSKENPKPVPTGNPWLPSDEDPATVPVPLPVIIVKIEGPFTERDHKLWVFLLAAAWDELDEKTIHELPVKAINRVFRDLGGEHDSKWIWNSVERLVKTIVRWEQTFGDERYDEGIASILSAVLSKRARAEGMLRYSFPALLIPILKDPYRYARLRLHFMIRLSGKYAVTLYELLESVSNKREPVLIAEIEDLRRWLKISEGKMPRFANLKQRVLAPAIKQINEDPVRAGFSVEMDFIKRGQAVRAVRFTLTKVDERLTLEKRLKDKAQLRQVPAEYSEPPHCSDILDMFQGILLPTDAYEQAQEAAPGWDIYSLEQEWREWMAKQNKEPQNPVRAFVGFCRKKARENPLKR